MARTKKKPKASPEEELKEKGNKAFTAGKYQQAVNLYT